MMERDTAHRLVSTALRQRGENLLLCELVIQYKGNVVEGIYNHSATAISATGSFRPLPCDSTVLPRNGCVGGRSFADIGKSRILVLSSGGNSSTRTKSNFVGVHEGLFWDKDRHSPLLVGSQHQHQHFLKLYLFSDVTLLPPNTSTGAGMMMSEPDSPNMNSMFGIEQKREYDLSRLERLTIPTTLTDNTIASSQLGLTPNSLGGDIFSSAFLVFDISDSPTSLSFSFESSVQRDTVVGIIKRLLRPFGERLDRIMSITVTPTAKIISYSNRGQQSPHISSGNLMRNDGAPISIRDTASVSQLSDHDVSNQDKTFDMDDLKQQRREQLQETKHRVFGAKEQQVLLFYMSEAAAAISKCEGNNSSKDVSTTKMISDSIYMNKNCDNEKNTIEYNNNLWNNNDRNNCTTTRLFDGIHHFSHLLDLKTQQLELHTIKSIIATKQTWEHIAVRASELAGILMSVDNRISEYSNNVLSRRLIIDNIEHKNIELRRQERNLTILHTRMSLIKDYLSLKSEMVIVINNMLRLATSDQLTRKDLEKETLMLENKEKNKGPIERLFTSSQYMKRTKSQNFSITEHHDGIVEFFLNDYNCMQINEAMLLMDRVLTGTGIDNRYIYNHTRTVNIGTMFTSTSNTFTTSPLEQEFPIAAVIERKKYYTELRRFICQSVKHYILSFLSVYERFLTTWVPHVTLSDVCKNKLTSQQAKEKKLYQRYGILDNTEEVPSIGGKVPSSSGKTQTQSLRQFAIGAPLNSCPGVGEPRWSKPSASSIVIPTHDEVHTKIASVQRVLCDMFRVDPEGYEQVLRRYTTVMNILYRIEVKSFFASLEEAVIKVGWRDDHSNTGSSNQESGIPEESDVNDAITISRWRSQRRKVYRWARRHGSVVGSLPYSSSPSLPPGGYLNGVFIEAKAVKGPSLLGRSGSGEGKSNDSHLTKEELLEHQSETVELGYSVPGQGINLLGIGTEIGRSRSNSNSRADEIGSSLFPLGGSSGSLSYSSIPPFASTEHSQGKAIHNDTVCTTTSNNRRHNLIPQQFLFQNILTVPTLPPAALDGENLAVYNISRNDWADEASEVGSEKRSSTTSRGVSFQAFNPRARSSSATRSTREGIVPMASRSAHRKSLHISVPELHLSQRRLHKPLYAQRSIELAALKQENSLKQFANASKRIDRITGRSGGGILRPDVAFGLALDTVVDLALKEEMLLRSAFGLTTGPEMEVQMSIVEAICRGRGLTSFSHLPTLDCPSSVVLPPHEVAYLRQLSMRELFCGGGDSAMSLLPRDGERKLRRLKPTRLLAGGPRLTSSEVFDCKAGPLLGGVKVDSRSDDKCESILLTLLGQLHSSTTPFLAYAEGAVGVSMVPGDGQNNAINKDLRLLSYDDEECGDEDINNDKDEGVINIARRGEDWRESANERKKRKIHTQERSLVDPYSILDDDMSIDNTLPIVIDSDAVSDYYVDSASSSSTCEEEISTVSSNIDKEKANSCHRPSLNTVYAKQLSKREKKLYRLSKGGGRNNRAVRHHLIERNVLKGCFYQFVSRVLTEKCDRIYVPSMLCMLDSVIGVAAESPCNDNNNINNDNTNTNNITPHLLAHPSNSRVTTLATSASQKVPINTFMFPVQRSYFLMNILLKIRSKLVASLHLYTYQQIQSILYCSHKYLSYSPLSSSSTGGHGDGAGSHSRKLFEGVLSGQDTSGRMALLPCFSRLPAFLSRMGSTHFALDLSSCSLNHSKSFDTVSYKYFDSFVLDMVEFSFNMLDTISLVGNSENGANNDHSNTYNSDTSDSTAKLILAGRKTSLFSRLFSKKESPVSTSSHSTTTTTTAAKSTKATMKVTMNGYLMQYRHNAFFCCTYAALPINSHCHRLLASRYQHCTRMRDYYEELYLMRVIFADAFPSFSSFISIAEDLSMTYSFEELSHNRYVSRDAVQKVISQLEEGFAYAMKVSASRIKRHLTSDIIEGNTAEEGFHRAILTATWKDYVAVVKRKVSFLRVTMLEGWPMLRGLGCNVTHTIIADVARLAAADA